MIHEVVFLNERKVHPNFNGSNQDLKNIWYLNNGASNHMCGNRGFFHSVDESVTGR